MRIISFCFVLILLSVSPSEAGQRGLLWRVVQACIFNHEVTGAAFPCLAVDTSAGKAAGYAVLRRPTEETHIIVAPTTRTIGVEARRLRGSAAPSYFHDAWVARGFMTDDLVGKPKRDDIALAVNSRLGRSQDQLHIHVACVRPEVKRALAAHSEEIRGPGWIQLDVLRGAHPYRAHFIENTDLAGFNVFDAVADGLHVKDTEMDDVTIVVVGAKPNGFFVLARRRLPHGFDEPHGEALLDPDCARFKKF